jgi:DNA-binding NarL/FixJ family response regulator
MRRLVFIDDDEAELTDFAQVVSSHYEYTTIHWPHESGKLFGKIPAPDIFVSDLYLPPTAGDAKPTATQRETAARAAKRVAELFLGLYADSPWDDKTRLRKTMRAIADAYEMLKMQWSALGQSPDHGVELLAKVRSQYPEVPFVFYSRKVTPEDVVHVLRSGAVDVIRKGALQKEEVLARLAGAQELWHRQDIRIIRNSGFNVNVTVISGQ